MPWRLHKEPNGVWYARNRKAGRNLKRSLDTKNKRVAEKRLEALIEQQSRPGRPMLSDIPTVQEILGDYVEHKKARNSDGWNRTIEGAVNGEHFAWALNRRLCDITTGDVQNWQNRLRTSGLTPATVNRYTSILSNLYTFALDRDLIELHHRPRIKRLKEERPPIRWFTDDEVRALFEVAPGIGDDVALFVHLGIQAGLRLAEILSLRCVDVDKTNGQIIICPHQDDGFRPKSRQERRVPIHPDLWAWLNKKTSGRYFPARGNPGQYRVDFKKPWAALMESAAIDPPAGTHAMRHTFGTWLARNRCSAFEIQALMGHSSVQVSERYIHIVGGKGLRQAVESLTFAPTLPAAEVIPGDGQEGRSG